MTQYVLLDTNILFRFVTQGEPGCEPEHFDALKEMVKSGKVILFNSDVVELEFAGQCKGLEDRLKREIRDIEERIATAIQGVIGESFPTDNRESKKKAWNEISDLHPWLKSETERFSAKLKQWPEDKLKEATHRIEAIKSLMSLPMVERLPFDQDIMLRTKRRFMSKRFKQFKTESKPEADYNIVDSVVRFFESHNGSHQVLLCSANTNDLAIEVEGKFVLHPTIKEDWLEGSGLFLSLSQLVQFVRDQKPLEEPSAEKVQEAVEREVAAGTFSQEAFYRFKIGISGKIRLFQTMQSSTFGGDSLSRKKLGHLITLMQTVLEVAGENLIRTSRLREAIDAVVTVANQFRSQDFTQADGLFMDIDALIAECNQISLSLPIPDQFFVTLKRDQ